MKKTSKTTIPAAVNDRQPAPRKRPAKKAAAAPQQPAPRKRPTKKAAAAKAAAEARETVFSQACYADCIARIQMMKKNSRVKAAAAMPQTEFAKVKHHWTFLLQWLIADSNEYLAAYFDKSKFADTLGISEQQKPDFYTFLEDFTKQFYQFFTCNDNVAKQLSTANHDSLCDGVEKGVTIGKKISAAVKEKQLSAARHAKGKPQREVLQPYFLRIDEAAANGEKKEAAIFEEWNNAKKAGNCKITYEGFKSAYRRYCKKSVNVAQ